MQHVVIYREPGRYAGWPANYGIWSWGDEIVVGFTLGYHDTGGGFHARDRSRPFAGMQARSLDGGVTWTAGPTPCRTPGGRGLSADEHMTPGLRVGEALGAEDRIPGSPGGFDFSHPDFALMCAKTGLNAGTVSFFYISTDRCASWRGPFGLPMYSPTGVEARTDYLVDDRRTCTLFLTATKADGREGRVLCARTDDGGLTFPLRGWIGPEPEGFSIMPAGLRLSPSRLLAAVRCRGPEDAGPARNWIDLYASEDDGITWALMARPVESTGVGGNPPTLDRLHDGRLCLVYGYRDAPHRMHARLSADQGATWGDPIVLRDHAGCHDIGYPRTVQRPDGTVVTVYYFCDRPDSERYLAATLWRP